MFSGLYASGFVDTTPLDNWVSSLSDPLQSKAETLIDFCYPNSAMFAPGSREMHGHDTFKNLLTADNLKHFLEEYKNFHSHWPMIHMPTFNPLDANNGLLLTMACLGAVYSDRLSVNEVRWLMEIVRASVYRTSDVYKLVTSQSSPQFVNLIDRPHSDIEEIQALVMLHSLFVWHGSQKQRQQGRAEFWVIVRVVRELGLLDTLPNGHSHFSTLHQPGPLHGDEVRNWSWNAWIEQEKRARTMYLILLIDAALTIFFNETPQFDMYEVKLPLPVDDATWEAKSAEDCASVLGLRGDPEYSTNVSGSQRAKQIGMAEALQLLYHGTDFHQRATNVYSKFILVHALHVQIHNIQRQVIELNNQGSYSSNGYSSNGTTTPEWASTDGNSGRATPVEGINDQYSQAHQQLRLTMSALENWKKMWDVDMAIQYPPHQRRVGFCRDGIHFYFLAKVFLRSSRRDEWTAPPDIRCQQVFGLLKQIRTHVATDSVQKGLDFGSVTAVDDNYGIADLTLNMRLLFTPVDH